MAAITCVWTLFFVSAFIGALSHHENHGAIHKPVPGEEVSIYDVPFMASVHNGDTYLCGGVMISENYVLSSDISLSRLQNDTSSVYVRVGYSHRDHDGVVYYISRITRIGTLALLQTRSPIQFDDTTKAASLPGQDQAYETDAGAQIIGWGHPGRKDEEGGIHTFLTALNVTLRDNDYCLDVYSNALYDSATMVCVSGHEGCTGSSPLVQNGLVIAFDGDACGCSEEGLPERFDSIAPLANRIRDAMEE